MSRSFLWAYQGQLYRSTTLVTPDMNDARCPKCGEAALVLLPEAIRAQQTDGTTHVCHPAIGGCNHGFTDLPEPSTVVSTKAPKRARKK